MKNTSELNDEFKEIEAYKDDPSKYYQAMRKVNSKTPKNPLRIYDDSFKLITPEEDQISKITESFDDLFPSDNIVISEETISITPEKIEPSFTPEEIQINLKTTRQHSLM